jgi:hypothetical protein
VFGRKKQPEPKQEHEQIEWVPVRGPSFTWDMTPEEIAAEVERATGTPAAEVNPDDWFWMPGWRRQQLRERHS